MKLIIQIPCFNEADTLEATFRDLPTKIPGVDVVEVMVVDDGSSDDTVAVARALGIPHIVQLGTNRGLAFAFSAGVRYALAHGADILVNTDGDNQYCGADIAKLVRPILENRADLVVGCRPILDHPEFGPVKKGLQTLGSKTLRLISKTTVRDAASGFRAFSRECLLRISIHSTFSYCMETLIQAGNSSLRVDSVDIRVNPKTRDSRLFKSIPQYVYRQAVTMLSMFLLYRPFGFFAFVGTFFLGFAGLLGLRYLYFTRFAENTVPGQNLIPSLTLLIVSALVGVLLYIFGFLGELLRTQRRLTEETLYYQRKVSWTSLNATHDRYDS